MGKILIVDDDEVTTKLYRNKLVSDGHTVTSIADGDNALIALKEPYDIIILDVMIPHIDGFTLLETIKKGINAHVPVLMVTNLINEETKQKARELGATEFLCKADFTPFTFIEKVYEYIGTNIHG